MTEEESVDIEKELDEHLTKVQPNLQDVIKRVNKINIVFPITFILHKFNYFFCIETKLCLTRVYFNFSELYQCCSATNKKWRKTKTRYFRRYIILCQKYTSVSLW